MCGSDGQTYDNECRLRYTKCTNSPDLEVVSQGPCPEPQENIDEGIPEIEQETATEIDEGIPQYDTNCGFDEFKCQSGDCIPLEQLCNGQEECPDGSDEIG